MGKVPLDGTMIHPKVGSPIVFCLFQSSWSRPYACSKSCIHYSSRTRMNTGDSCHWLFSTLLYFPARCCAQLGVLRAAANLCVTCRILPPDIITHYKRRGTVKVW